MARALARTLVTAGLAAGLAVPLVGAGGPALADPKNAQVIELTCGGTTYHVAVFGNGLFAPALDIHGTTVFVPHAFTGFHGSLYAPDGTLIEHATEPDEIQGSGNQPMDTVCTYRITYTFTGEEGPGAPPAGSVFVGTGTVSGQRTGR